MTSGFEGHGEGEGGKKKQLLHSHYRNGIVIKDRRNIFGGEFVGGVADEKARLANSTVADDNASKKQLHDRLARV